jgi:hypothetical protein
VKTARLYFETWHDFRRFGRSPAEVNAILNKGLDGEITDPHPTLAHLAHEPFLREQRAC